MENQSIYKFTPEKLRELQLKELDTLLYFKKFCEKNNLTFYFCGGCCIGSLRNGGFIPWDDDIDIFMPRKDYERMITLWRKQVKSKRFVLLKTDDEMYTANVFATIVDTSATCIKTYQTELDIPHGLVMDVFPIDACPEGFKRKLQLFWTLIYSLYMAQVVPINHGKLMALGSRILLGIVPSRKLRNKIWRFAEKQMTKYKLEDCQYITELCAGPHYMKNRYPKRIFDKAVYVDFEGYKMPIPCGYDEYLSLAFGDYMTLPPKEKQVPHHDVVFCDLENSYTKYKGIYYCKNKKD